MSHRMLCIALALLAAPAASAHQLWLNTTRYIVQQGEGHGGHIHAGAAYVGWGHAYPADELPPHETLGPITVHAPGGGTETVTRDTTGFLVAPLEFRGTGPHVLTIAHEGGFYTVYEEDGETKHAQTSKEGLDNVQVSQYFEMVGKTLVSVGETAETDFTAPVGQTIEIVPLVNPYTLKAGEGTKLPVRVLLNGEPAKNAFVDTIHAGVPDGMFVQTVETNVTGRATVNLTHTGPWMIKATAKAPLREAFEGKANEESYTATLTFLAR